MTNTKFTFIHSVLHFNGAKRDLLTPEQMLDVRKLADGYGAGTVDPVLLWDWSHVRDSSDSAIDLMYARIWELS